MEIVNHMNMSDEGAYKLEYVEEPLLEFGYKQKLLYPRDGLFLYGPIRDKDAIDSIKFGVIGTKEGVQRFNLWAASINTFINIPPPGPRSKAIEPHHVPFPGFHEAFHAKWPSKPLISISDIDVKEINYRLDIENRHEAVKLVVDLYVDRIVSEQNRHEATPDFWFIVIPEVVYRKGRPESKIPKNERIQGDIDISAARAKSLRVQPTLFGYEEKDAEIYQYAKNFRRQLKARLLEHRVVTQIVRETTLTPDEFVGPKGFPVRRVEDPATIAWKLCTSAFYKAGGRPWQLANVRPGVCYVGLVYKQIDPQGDNRFACCAAQMFLTNGDGVVFRGALGPWYSPEIGQYHLDRESASKLVEMVISEYILQHGVPPSELFIHAQAEFKDDEWNGFMDSCPNTTNLVGVQIKSTRYSLKLFRFGEYPVLRGTALRTSKSTAFLFTTGFVPRLDTYMGPETPSPIQIRILRGKSDLSVILKDIMGLTKINFNSCLYNDRMPVTIRFANAVGDVLISAPIKGEPKLPFKYYI